MPTFRVSSSTALSTLLGAGIYLGLASPTFAVTVSYNTTHNFNFFVGGNTTPGVRGFDRGSAFAFSPFSPPFFQSASYGLNVYPLAPPFTRFDTTGVVSVGLASAQASSSTTISSLGIGSVSGTISAFGSATAIERGERACATSLTGVVARQRFIVPFLGAIFWGPRLAWDFVGGGGCAVRRIDPISFTVTDPATGELLRSGKLLDISNTGDGSVNWGDQSLDFDLTDGTFNITLDDPVIPNNQRGTLILEVQNGIITRSEDTGRFDGWLPTAGSSGKFSINPGTVANFSPDLQFDYALGDFGREVELELTADGGTEVVPEPSTITPLSVGILGVVFWGWKRRRQGSE